MLASVASPNFWDTPRWPRMVCLAEMIGRASLGLPPGWANDRRRVMLIAHAGKQPRIDRSAWIAPDTTICGDVVIGPGTRVMHGARLIGEGGGAISVGRDCIVMEN